MHEMSLALELLDNVREQLQAQEIPDAWVREIHLKIGEFSGVSVDALQFAFEMVRVGTQLESATLVIHQTPLVILCTKCEQETELDKPDFICPECGSTETMIISGQEMVMESLIVEEETR